MLCLIERTVRDFQMFAPGLRVLCAVSGGADSVALLCAMLALKEKLGVSEIACAHYNHRLRGAESDRDERFTRDLCARLGVRFFCGAGDVRAFSEQAKLGTEAAAREMRYGFLLSTLEKEGFDTLLTAHTADDNLETVLINLTRGSGLPGLCGIPPVRGKIARPLLAVTRSQVLRFLSELGQDFVSDSSNSDPVYLRNALRQRAIPALSARNPALARAVYDASVRLREDEALLALLANRALKDIQKEKGLYCPQLNALAAPLARRAVMYWFLCAGGDRSLTARQVDAVLRLAASTRPSGRLSLPGGLTARRSYDFLTLEKARTDAAFASFLLKTGVSGPVGDTGYGISCYLVEYPEDFNNSVNTFYIDRDIIAKGVLVRPRMEGDRFTLPGRAVTKTLKKLFIEAKIPACLRGRVPVLDCGGAVVAVAGFGADPRYRPATPGNAARIDITGDLK